MTNEPVKVIKLSSGEVLVANLVSEDSGLLKIKNVARIVEVSPTAQQAERGEVNIVMVPFMPFTKASVETNLGSDQIVFIVDPIQEIVDSHRNEFSKIMKPKSKGLILPK